MPLHDTNLTLQVQYPRELSQKGESPLVESDLVGLQISVSEFFSVLVEGQQRTNKIQFLLSWASREVCTSVSQQLGFESVTSQTKKRVIFMGLQVDLSLTQAAHSNWKQRGQILLQFSSF